MGSSTYCHLINPNCYLIFCKQTHAACSQFTETILSKLSRLLKAPVWPWMRHEQVVLASYRSTPHPSSSALFSPPMAAGKVALLARLPDSELSLNSEPGALVLRTFAQMYENSKHLRDGSKQPFQEQHLAAPRQDKEKGATVCIRSESLFPTLRNTTGINGLISLDFDCEPSL